jgi:O-succinylbenzoic acid--CoA ligase
MRCFFAGAAIALPEKNSLPRALSAFAVTHLSLVPTQVYRLLQTKHFCARQLSLRYLLIGGAPLSQDLRQQVINRGFKAYYSYGLTEMASQVATTEAGSEYFSTPLPYREWQLVNGEIALKGATLFLGYLIKGKVKHSLKNGWFFSKDLAEQGPQGIHISGRKDNMFVCSGENCQPESIEQTIKRFTGVANVVVVDVADAEFGRVPAAFIQWQGAENENALLTFLRQHIASYQLPKYFFPWQQAPSQGIKLNRQWYKEQAAKYVP